MLEKSTESEILAAIFLAAHDCPGREIGEDTAFDGNFFIYQPKLLLVNRKRGPGKEQTMCLSLVASSSRFLV